MDLAHQTMKQGFSVESATAINFVSLSTLCHNYLYENYFFRSEVYQSILYTCNELSISVVESVVIL